MLETAIVAAAIVLAGWWLYKSGLRLGGQRGFTAGRRWRVKHHRQRRS